MLNMLTESGKQTWKLILVVILDNSLRICSNISQVAGGQNNKQQ